MTNFSRACEKLGDLQIFTANFAMLLCCTQVQHIYTFGQTRGQSNLTKSASRGAHSPVRGHPRGSKVVPLNSWGRVSY